MWRWLLYILAWLSADPVEIDAIHARAAAAATIARASLLTEAPKPGPKPPAPTECVCGETCKRGVWKPDGRVEQRCECTCDRCRKERATPPPPAPPASAPLPLGNCPGGVCPKPSAVRVYR